MKQINARIRRESIDSAVAAGRYNQGLQLIVRDKRRDFNLILPIGAGTSDDVSVFTDTDTIYVVAVNSGLDYAGLETFDRHTGEPLGDCFAQEDYNVREMIGPKGTDYHPRTIARRLAEYIY